MTDMKILQLSEPDSSAAILMFEHTWAKPLRDAVVDSGGIVEADLRIPRAVVEELLVTVPDEDGNTPTEGEACDDGWADRASSGRGPEPPSSPAPQQP